MIGSVDPVYMQSPNMTCRVQEERQKAKGKRQKAKGKRQKAKGKKRGHCINLFTV